MRPAQFSADTLITLLRKQAIASLPEVMAALGTRTSRCTAFRKLKDLAARTSYSHRGGYYTLDELVDIDERGLWSFAEVRFSRIGTLIATAESFVSHAEAGHFAEELDNLLHVGTQDALRKLVRDGRQTRHQLTGQFLYCAADRAQQAQQLRVRRLLLATPGLVRPLPDADLMPEELRPAIMLFASLFDERPRRLFADQMRPEKSRSISTRSTRGSPPSARARYSLSCSGTSSGRPARARRPVCSGSATPDGPAAALRRVLRRERRQPTHLGRNAEPSIGAMSQGEYGAQVALQRVVDLMDRHGMVELQVEWIVDDAPTMNPRGNSHTPPRELLQVLHRRVRQGVRGRGR